MTPLNHKKDRGISKSGFVVKDQSVTLNFELSNIYRAKQYDFKCVQFNIGGKSTFFYRV